MLNDIIKKVLREATSDSSGSRGSFVVPLRPGLKKFDKTQLAPFTEKVSNYDSPLLDYDSYDGKMSETKKQIKKIEGKAEKSTKYLKNHPIQNDDDGDIINPTPGKGKKFVPIKESSTSISAGEYSGPIELGLKKWKHQLLAPFTEFVDTEINHKKKQKTMKNNIKKQVGVWEKNPGGTYKQDDHDVHTIKEDLAVWFGTKKKPKGSKQPKGPWVDICRKVNGKHPPCGRSDSDSGAYPKCRAVGVAGKMSDSAKKAACQQKRKAEKKDTQTGKGQKPIMTSYKPRKKTNENMKTIRLTESELVRIVKKILNEETSMGLKKENPQMIMVDKLWNRKMITPIDNTNISVQKGYEVWYGYDNVGRKIVESSKVMSTFGRVELNCNTSMVDYDTMATKKYEEYSIDIERQKQSDFDFLNPYCSMIDWKYGDKPKKR